SARSVVTNSHASRKEQNHEQARRFRNPRRDGRSVVVTSLAQRARDGQRREQTMKKTIRLALVAGAAAALASALAIAVRAAPTNHANRLEVTFTETAASIT